MEAPRIEVIEEVSSMVEESRIVGAPCTIEIPKMVDIILKLKVLQLE